MQAIIWASNQQIAYVEAIIRLTGARKIICFSDIPLWESQKKYKPVVHASEYELVTGGFFKLSGGMFPFKIKFEYHEMNDRANMQMTRRCLDELQTVMPEIFAPIEWEDGEEIKEIELNKTVEDLLPQLNAAKTKSR